jgi:tetratricopeptide (TPR) repeat protein
MTAMVGPSLSAAGQASTFAEATRAGFAAYRDGNDAQAEAWLRTALKEAESFPHEDSRLPKALHNLAMVLSSEGKLSEAEQLIRRALAIREQVSGKESEDVAVSLNNLAILLYEQHRYAEAEEALRGVLSIDARILPDDHKERRLSLENYAKVLRKLNNFQEAARVESMGTAYRPSPKDVSTVGAMKP